MKHQYEDYIKFINQKKEECEDEGSRFRNLFYKDSIAQFRASLLANKATLERHKEVVHYKSPTREQKKAGMDYTDPSLAYSTCSCAFVEHYIAGDGYPSISVGTNAFPCPSLLDVTNQLDEVMG